MILFLACEKSITIDSAFRSPSRIISTIRLSPINPDSASRKLKSMTVRSLIKSFTATSLIKQKSLFRKRKEEASIILLH
ncbi:hypothetical protein UUU_24970 (plasmid) [Klebsiella pneumoniae subsp. pneumoniae DSM 30104 = JCM 1662 = NBRC 14940]|nr:hypothetical protein UUU_24970 [Klebsiella pneumoniae subsp. pneumoniae DSM 30104 = JCM 1662 = NBRC 14940]